MASWFSSSAKSPGAAFAAVALRGEVKGEVDETGGQWEKRRGKQDSLRSDGLGAGTRVCTGTRDDWWRDTDAELSKGKRKKTKKKGETQVSVAAPLLLSPPSSTVSALLQSALNIEHSATARALRIGHWSGKGRGSRF